MQAFAEKLSKWKSEAGLSNRSDIGSSALVLGGSGGIGEAIVCELLNRGWDSIIVADCVMPKTDDCRVSWQRIDLAFDDISELIATAKNIDTLIITAGVGRLNRFKTFGVNELERTMRINSIAPMEVIQGFSEKLLLNKPFYTAIITSIAALVASPLYAVYSASKGALSRYIEAVNAELAGEGCENRILEVVPGRIDGTGFHGGEQQGPDALMPLAACIVDYMLLRKVRLIPNSDTYNGVIARYNENPTKFGESSYLYKLEHTQLERGREPILGYLSGTFDLFHVGHLNLLKRARAQCDRLIVGVHGSGAWKGKETFIPLDERKALLAACRYVDEVIDAPDEDDEAWDIIHYNRLFVGSDYKGTDRFNRYEHELGTAGVEIVYFPYTKGTSSTQIRLAITESAKHKEVS